MELKTLRYFVAVAEELHFGRAAKRLHISQPPLSRQIRNLEREIGTVLLRRTRRRVELTRAGEIFLRHILQLLTGLDEATAAVRRVERGEIGRLVIGFFRGAIYSLLPEILRHFRAESPKVEVVLRELEINEVPQALVDNVIDVGFMRPPVAHPGVETELMLSEPVLAALPAGNALARKKQLKLSDLALQPFVTYSQSSLMGHQLISACLRAGFNPKVVQQARYPEILIGLVRSGAGVALVSSSHRARGAKGVTFRKLVGDLPKAEIVVAWRREDKAPLLERFLESARKARRILHE